MEQPNEWASNSGKVSALEYTTGLIRAARYAGLTIQIAHINLIQAKMFDEAQLPRLRVIQMLNRLADAEKTSSKSIEISVEDARVILQAARNFT